MAEPRADGLQGPEPGQELEEPRRLRAVAPHERLAEDDPGALRRVEGLLHVGGTARVWLLAEHVLAGRDRLERPLVVEQVREGDVDGVDLVVCEQLLVGAVCARDAVLAGVALGPLTVAARDGADLDVLLLRGPRQDLAVDVRRGEQAPADRSAHHSPLVSWWSWGRIVARQDARAVRPVAVVKRPGRARTAPAR